MCVCVCVRVCVCVYMRLRTCARDYVRMFTCVCVVFLCLLLCVCKCNSMYLRICSCMCECVGICECVYVKVLLETTDFHLHKLNKIKVVYKKKEKKAEYWKLSPPPFSLSLPLFLPVNLHTPTSQQGRLGFLSRAFPKCTRVEGHESTFFFYLYDSPG